MNKIFRFLKKYEFPVHLLVAGRVIASELSAGVHTLITKAKLRALGCAYGKGLRVDGRLWIWTKRKGGVQLGYNVKITSRFGANLVGLTNPTVFQCLENGTITIGNNSGLSSAILSSRARIAIGNNVKLGGNVRVFDHDYHSLNYETRRGEEDGFHIKTRPVTIGDDVFVGTNAMILKGVTIGSRSIVGAGSVVSRDVPADEIWAGNPAQFIKKIESPHE